MEQLTADNTLNQYHSWHITGSHIEECRTFQRAKPASKTNDVSTISRRNRCKYYEGNPFIKYFFT